MKDCLKVVFITLIGLITAILIHPTLHEIGHMLVTLLFGGGVKELHVFPTTYVVCDMSNTRVFGKTIIELLIDC